MLTDEELAEIAEDAQRYPWLKQRYAQAIVAELQAWRTWARTLTDTEQVILAGACLLPELEPVDG